MGVPTTVGPAPVHAPGRAAGAAVRLAPPSSALPVLVVVGDAQRAVGLAAAMASLGLVPVLAFSATQAFASLAMADLALVVADVEALGGHATAMVDAAAKRSSGGLLAVLPTASSEPVPGAAGTAWAAATDIELAVRAYALAAAAGHGPPTSWGSLELDPQLRMAWWSRTPLRLTRTQYRLLAVLVAAQGAVVELAELSERVWGCRYVGDTERIGVQVRRLRRQIELAGGGAGTIITVRGEGFRLQALA